MKKTIKGSDLSIEIYNTHMKILQTITECECEGKIPIAEYIFDDRNVMIGVATALKEEGINVSDVKTTESGKIKIIFGKLKDKTDENIQPYLGEKINIKPDTQSIIDDYERHML